MARQNKSGREAPGDGGPPSVKSLKERLGALKNLPAFIALIWRTSPLLTTSSLALRLVRALVPIITLFIGKLIIDEVVLLVQKPEHPQTLAQWWASGLLNW